MGQSGSCIRFCCRASHGATGTHVERIIPADNVAALLVGELSENHRSAENEGPGVTGLEPASARPLFSEHDLEYLLESYAARPSAVIFVRLYTEVFDAKQGGERQAVMSLFQEAVGREVAALVAATNRAVLSSEDLVPRLQQLLITWRRARRRLYLLQKACGNQGADDEVDLSGGEALRTQWPQCARSLWQEMDSVSEAHELQELDAGSLRDLVLAWARLPCRPERVPVPASALRQSVAPRAIVSLLHKHLAGSLVTEGEQRRDGLDAGQKVRKNGLLMSQILSWLNDADIFQTFGISS